MKTLQEANILQCNVESADFFQTFSEHFVFVHNSDVLENGKKYVFIHFCL